MEYVKTFLVKFYVLSFDTYLLQLLIILNYNGYYFDFFDFRVIILK